MKKSSTIFLQVVVLLIGVGMFVLLLVEPLHEGVNVNKTLSQIYFHDPFLAYMYIGSIPFFIAVYQGFKLLGYARKNKVFSLAAVKALNTVKYCAAVIIIFLVGAEAYSFIFIRGKDDIAGGAMLGFIMILVSIVVASVAGMFGKIIQNGVDIKSENDLTV